ncbi:MAG: oxygen-independent coproporphyrinogen III oxidase [Sedimenticola sp.]|jgi:oxygen-independent coproporphyrinogen-3 oxidase|nr:MAG: oxygen-independent coproporphyrinogen III oxidase [Sedimenticola sp.]
MDQTLVFDLDLINKYDYAGPRYTSYPTAPQFHDGFADSDYRAAAQRSNESGQPLSLYFHIPFCDTICFYCACNKIATKDRGLNAPYLQRLYKEIEMQGQLYDNSRKVDQLHWGGGTPTFLSLEQMQELMRVTGEHFQLADDNSGEYSIEIDPREATAETVRVLSEAGFNRMSLGVQDFDEKVQKAVNRIQTEEETFAVLDAAKANGFRSVSIDLIYGLPFQSVDSFARTLDRVLEVGPDRLSVFNYAHLPQMFKPQRRINEAELPQPEVKLEILKMTIDHLTDAGYIYVGMDHFARPDDELAIAQREGSLYRNFQGYSTHSDCDLVAMGVTSISMVGNTYSQNVRDLESYYERLDAGKLPVLRGIELSQDDLIRRDVITQLICNFTLPFERIDQAWGISCTDYFTEELARMEPMIDDGLLEKHANGLVVLPRGRLLIRNICMAFDKYLPPLSQQKNFSRVI